jgi:hypothetical protein
MSTRRHDTDDHDFNLHRWENHRILSKCKNTEDAIGTAYFIQNQKIVGTVVSNNDPLNLKCQCWWRCFTIPALFNVPSSYINMKLTFNIKRCKPGWEAVVFTSSPDMAAGLQFHSLVHFAWQRCGTIRAGDNAWLVWRSAFSGVQIARIELPYTGTK